MQPQNEQILLAELANALDQELILLERNKLDLYVPHHNGPDGGQLAYHQAAGTHKIRCAITGNRYGKSTAAVVDAIKLALGTHEYCKRFPVPVKIKVFGDSYQQVMENIKLKFEQWLPLEALDPKKPFETNQMGMLTGIRFANRSYIKIGSYDQDCRKSEGSDWDAIYFDEPPSRDVYVANLRGLADRNGIMSITATPLSEAWMFDDLWMPGMTGQKPFIKCIRGSGHDNPHTDKMGLQLFLDELTPDERKIRELGEFARLKGLVIDTYQPAVADIDDFDLTDEFILYEGIDPHLHKPHTALWKALRNDGKRFVVAELYTRGGIKEFGEEIHEKRQMLTRFGAPLIQSICDTSLNQVDPMSRLNLKDELSNVLRSLGEDVVPYNAQKRDWLMPGIQKLKDLYRVFQNKETGKPECNQYVFKSCSKYRYELFHYQWPEKEFGDNIKPIARHNDGIDCFEEGVEVLTSTGWKFFKDLSFEDEIGTVNLKKDLIEFQKPIGLMNYLYDGEMVEFKLGNKKVKVTPNHRMVIHTSSVDSDAVIVLADSLKKSNCLKVISNWEGKELTEFKIPGVETHRLKYLKDDFIIKDIDSFFSFLGWYVAEGCLDKPQFPGRGFQVVVAQNKGIKKDKIFEDISKFGFHPRMTARAVVFTDKRMWHWLDEHVRQYSFNKKVPDIVKNASPRLIEIFINSAVDGDGWRQAGRRSYATVSKRLADDFQELFLKIGRRATMSLVRAKDYNIRGRKGFARNCLDQFHIHECTSKKSFLYSRKGSTSHGKNSIKKVFYFGYVGCATVPNGTLIVRKDGKTFICGNCDRYIESLTPHFQTPGARFIKTGSPDAYRRQSWRERENRI